MCSFILFALSSKCGAPKKKPRILISRHVKQYHEWRRIYLSQDNFSRSNLGWSPGFSLPSSQFNNQPSIPQSINNNNKKPHTARHHINMKQRLAQRTHSGNEKFPEDGLQKTKPLVLVTGPDWILQNGGSCSLCRFRGKLKIAQEAIYMPLHTLQCLPALKIKSSTSTALVETAVWERAMVSSCLGIHSGGYGEIYFNIVKVNAKIVPELVWLGTSYLCLAIFYVDNIASHSNPFKVSESCVKHYKTWNWVC